MADGGTHTPEDSMVEKLTVENPANVYLERITEMRCTYLPLQLKVWQLQWIYNF